MLGRLWRWLTGRAGCRHRWDVFQVAWRRRCPRCGRVEDWLTGEAWPSVEAYLGHPPGTIPVLPQGGSGTARPSGESFVPVRLPGTLERPPMTLRVPVVDALPPAPAVADLVCHDGRIKLWTGEGWVPARRDDGSDK